LLDPPGTTKIVDGKLVQKCPKCGAEAPKQDFKAVTKKVRGYLCLRCNYYVPDVSAFGLGQSDVFCARCHRVVAFGLSKRRKVPEEQIMTPTRGIRSRATRVGKGLFILQTRHEWDRLVLRCLNRMARFEKYEFKRVRLSSGLLILSNVEYLGYLSWDRDEDSVPVVRQLYVVPARRRRGNASLLLRFFDSRVALKTPVGGHRFLVDSPNEKTVKLLGKLGFLDGRCAFIRGFQAVSRERLDACTPSH
jgi:GNAT superfamily N-acetyltransferase